MIMATYLLERDDFLNSNMEKMLEMASKKLGTSPDKLKSAIEKGSFDGVLGNLSKEDTQKLMQVMNNPELREKLMKSPEAMALFKKMAGK